MLSLFGGWPMAQRTLPGMRSVEVKANMVDGFYTGSARDCGYSFGIYYSVFKGNNAHEWTFGVEYLQTYKPYGENGRIPVAEFTGEAGYNLHLYSNYSQFFHLYGSISALAGYETTNWGKTLLADRATLHNSDAFIHGGAVNLQADFYHSDRIALSANLKERFIFGNSTGHFHTQYGVGVKFIIE